MMSYIDKAYQGGFSFENAERNKALVSEEDLKKHFTKTGTTIVGVVFDGGVVLAADTRATAGRIVVKNCDKIHFISKNITCCGAGTAADCEYVTSGLTREDRRPARAHAPQHGPAADGVDLRGAGDPGAVQVRRAHRRLPDRGRVRLERRAPLPDLRERIVG